MTQRIQPLEQPNEDDYTTVATRRMWRWVVIQAGLEANMQGMPDVDARWKRRASRLAIKWLTTDSPDLREVCANAGFDVNTVMRGARRRFGRKNGSGSSIN